MSKDPEPQGKIKDDGPAPAPAPVEEDKKDEEDEKPIVADSSESFCRTPTSEDHKIPRSRSCPPAPRKPKQRHKRKLSDTQFFETNKDLESLFESCGAQQPTARTVKRRNTSSTTKSPSNNTL